MNGNGNDKRKNEIKKETELRKFFGAWCLKNSISYFVLPSLSVCYNNKNKKNLCKN